MTIGVGQDSFDVLRDRANSLFCGMGKATFTIVKSCKENKTVLQSSAGNKSNSTEKVETSQQKQDQVKSTSAGDRMDTGTADGDTRPVVTQEQAKILLPALCSPPSQHDPKPACVTNTTDTPPECIRVKQINLHRCKSATFLIDIALQKAQTKK